MVDADPNTTMVQMLATIQQKLQYLGQRLDRVEQPFSNPLPLQNQMEPEPPDCTRRKDYSFVAVSTRRLSKRAETWQQQSYEFYGEEDSHAYLVWQELMEEIFDYPYHNMEHRKVSTAAQYLKGEAKHWWNYVNKMRRNYKKAPIASWTEMKEHMVKRFAPAYHQHQVSVSYPISSTKTMHQIQPQHTCVEPATSKPMVNDLLLPTNLRTEPTLSSVAAKQVKRHTQASAQISTENSKPLLGPQDNKPQGKSPNHMNSDGMDCYKYFAATYPTRQVVNPTPLELKSESSKSSTSLENCDLKPFNSSVMHLSLSKNVNEGIGITMEPAVQEEPPALVMDQTPSVAPHLNEKQGMVSTPQKEAEQEEIQPEVPKPCIEVTTIRLEHKSISPYALKKEQELNTTPFLFPQVTTEEEKNQVTSNHELILSINNCSNASMIHVSTAKGAEKISGTHNESKKQEHEITDQRKGHIESSSSVLKPIDQKPWKGVIASLLIKEEPPSTKTSLPSFKRDNETPQPGFLYRTKASPTFNSKSTK